MALKNIHAQNSKLWMMFCLGLCVFGAALEDVTLNRWVKATFFVWPVELLNFVLIKYWGIISSKLTDKIINEI